MNNPTEVLLIEDNPGDVRLVKEALAEAGASLYKLALGNTLTKGLSHLEKKHIDAVLLDLTLPDSTGLDTFKKVNEKVPQVPIIILTGLQDEDQATRAVREGAQDYLVKGKTDGELLVRSIRYAIERKMAERKLAQSKERYRQLFENSGTGITIVDENGQYILVNKLSAAVFGKTPDEIIGKSMFDFLPRHQADHYLEFNRQLICIGGFREYEDTFQFPTGEQTFLIVDRCIEDENGRNFAVQSSSIDITRRKQSELALARQTKELDRLYQASASLFSSNPFDLHILAQTIVDVILKQFGQANCSVFIVQEDSNELSRLAAGGPYADQVSKTILTIGGAGIVPEAIQTGRVINASDVRTFPSYIPAWEAARAELAIPLRINDQSIGAIDIQSAEPGAFNADDERIMSIFAERAALALEHTRLFAETEKRLKNLISLRVIDQAISNSFDLSLSLGILLDQVMKRLGVHAVAILVFNTISQTFQYSSGQGFHTQALQHTNIRLGDGYAGRAGRERRTIIIQNLEKNLAEFERSATFLQEGFTSYMGIPLIAKGEIKGIMEIFHREPLKLNQEGKDFLEILAGQAAIAIDNAELFNQLQVSNAELMMAYDETIEGWSRAMDLRDEETEEHADRVTQITLKLASKLNFTAKEMVHIRRGALLHDIGKIGVPDKILRKPGPLTEEEWGIMQKHPQLAFDMLAPILYLRPATEIPYCHHEKWDGTGYPRGLKGEQIPLAARAFAVVDVWDALMSDRPYRKAWPREKVLDYIREQSGKHFDPKVVDTFLKMVYGVG